MHAAGTALRVGPTEKPTSSGSQRLATNLICPLLDHLLSKRVLERRRATVILVKWRGVRPSVICKLLRLSPPTSTGFRRRRSTALFTRRTHIARMTVKRSEMLCPILYISRRVISGSIARLRRCVQTKAALALPVGANSDQRKNSNVAT
jgi:hypothetical protein